MDEPAMRYSVDRCDNGDCNAYLEPDGTGDWVRFEDYQTLALKLDTAEQDVRYWNDKHRFLDAERHEQVRELQSRLDSIAQLVLLASIHSVDTPYRYAIHDIDCVLKGEPTKYWHKDAAVERQRRKNCLKFDCREESVDESNYCRDHLPKHVPRGKRVKSE